jgi:DNA sulfur modification protein DndB
MRKISLPCLRGVLGEWTYFNTTMKIKDIVDNKRVKTVSESKELYSSKLNDVLQREINESRIKTIANYLCNNSEHFFSSLILAINGGDPQWFDFNIEKHYRNNNILEEDLNFIENKLGVLSLSGDENIFALDGQHRLLGIRAAFEKCPEIGEEEISLIFVIHNDNLKERTRRLFTVLNKYAQKPKEAELIILDEDDAHSILTRKIIQTHRIFKLQNAISGTNSSNLYSSDTSNFTTIVTINRVHLELLKEFKIDKTQRPSDDLLDQYYDELLRFWNFLFEIFPEIERFINGDTIELNGKIFNRNKLTGGSLLLRPIGQILISKIFVAFRKTDRIDDLKKGIRSVDFDLNGRLCKYIYFLNGQMLPKEEALKNRVFFYTFGLDTNEDIHLEMKRVYTKYGDNYENKIVALE